MKEFSISSKEAGQRMDKYLFKILNQASKGFVYKMLRKKNIVLNDKKATGQEVLKAADQIKIYLSDETFDKFASALVEASEAKQPVKTTAGNGKSTVKTTAVRHPKIQIVYEDDDILILNKPVGLLSQKAEKEDYSANEMVIDYLLESGQLTRAELRTFHPSICNRLDRNTSGLLIAGKTMHGLQEMAEALKSRSMQKYYRCLVAGRIEQDAHLKGYLAKDHQSNKVTIRKEAFADASYIATAYHPIKVYENMTLLEVHLITGRSHQIRAHLASIGHPILGDTKYGDRKVNQTVKDSCRVRSQLLHAYRMEFPDGKIVTAPEPAAFERVQTKLAKEKR